MMLCHYAVLYDAKPFLPYPYLVDNNCLGMGRATGLDLNSSITQLR